MNLHNITISDDLKYLFNKNDSINACIILILMELFSIMKKAFILSFIYNNLLKYGFKKLHEVKYIWENI